MSYTKFAKCKIVQIVWKTVEKEKKRQTLCQIEYLTESPILTEMRNQTRPDQTRPENQQRDLAFKRSIHHHCSQWYPLWGFELMTICHLTSDPWPNETSDFYSQQSFTRWNAQRVRTHNSMRRKKEEIWLSPMTKVPTLTEKSKKQRDNTKTLPKLGLHNDLRTYLGRSPNWCG